MVVTERGRSMASLSRLQILSEVLAELFIDRFLESVFVALFEGKGDPLRLLELFELRAYFSTQTLYFLNQIPCCPWSSRSLPRLWTASGDASRVFRVSRESFMSGFNDSRDTPKRKLRI